MRAEIARVFACAVDQCGLSAPQELLPCKIQPRGFRYAPLVSNQAPCDRAIEPRIIRTLAGPYDRSGLASQIHAEERRCLDPRWWHALRWRDRAV
jgi:hypothetical protein